MQNEDDSSMPSSDVEDSSKREFLRDASSLAIAAPFARIPIQSLAWRGALGVAATGTVLPAAADPTLLISSWPFSEGGGTLVQDRETGAMAAINGSLSNVWKPGVPGVSSHINNVRLACSVASGAVLAQIMDMKAMVPGETQICVWWTLTHPTGTPPTGPLWFWGINAGSTNVGWGVSINGTSQWPALDLRARGASKLASYPLDANQTSLKLNVNGGNTRTYCCLTIERSKPAPGYLVLKFYAQPFAQVGEKATQSLLTVPELANGATALPGAEQTKLTFFAQATGASSYGASLAQGYSLCNWGAARRSSSIDNIGARIAKELAKLGTDGIYTLPASATALA